jgi:hypothetical protein
MARREHHQVTWILAGGAVLVGADALLWAAWILVRLLPVLLPAAAAVWACRRWKLHRRASALLTGTPGQRPPVRLIASQPVTDAVELERLRSDNAKLRTKVRVLSDMLNGEPEVRP